MGETTCRQMHDMFRTLQMAMSAEDRFLTGPEIVNLAVDWSAAGAKRGGGSRAESVSMSQKSNANLILILDAHHRLAFGTKSPQLVRGHGHF